MSLFDAFKEKGYTSGFVVGLGVGIALFLLTIKMVYVAAH